MKLKLKALAAALAMSSAPAFAAIDNFGTGNGELFFNVYDPVARVSFVFDLTPTTGAPSGSLNLNDFLPNYYTGNAAYRSNLTTAAITGATTGAASAMETPGTLLRWTLTGLNDWSSFVSASNPANWRWNVVAGDGTGSQGTSVPASAQRYLTTGQAIGMVDNITTTQMNNSMRTRDGTYINLLNGKNTSEPADYSDFNSAAVTGDVYFADTFGPSWGIAGGPDSTVAFGQSSFFYYVTGRAATNVAVAQYGNAAGAATWQMALDTTTGEYYLQYTAPIPEPGNWAMLAAGLVAVGAVVRRRTSSR